MNNQFAGWMGEKATAWGLSQSLDPGVYRRIDDLIVPNGRGGTTQIDHVIISVFGIFVLEVKNRNGLIVGSPNDSIWRQISGNHTYEFQNPIKQNDRHIAALSQLLRFRPLFFHSIIFFCGQVKLRSKMPFHVRTDGVVTFIRTKSAEILWPDEVQYAHDRLIACKTDRNLTLERHLRYVSNLSHHAA